MINKRFLKNRKGTAEVIGTMMFIVILLFFFTNVYLWHDAATKDANQLNLKQISATFSIRQIQPGSFSINVSAVGSDIVLSRLWIIDANGNHLYADVNDNSNRVAAGITTQPIDLRSQSYYNAQDGKAVNNPTFSMPTKCWVVNTLGITEYYTLQP
jgi:hypothetical protein